MTDMLESENIPQIEHHYVPKIQMDKNGLPKKYLATGCFYSFVFN